MKKLKLIIITLLMPVILLSCAQNVMDVTNVASVTDNSAINTPDTQGKNTQEVVTITILANNDILLNDERRELFKKVYPNVKINYVKKEYANTEIIMNELSTGNGNDIIQIERDQMGEFATTDGFEDLLQPPYNAGEILNIFQEHQLSWTKSLDGKKLLALALTHSPKVTYYREDILKQYGFPTEPEELAKYMEKHENWLNMARELKKHDKWIMAWRPEPLEISGAYTGYFDKNLNFNRNTQDYAKLLSAVKTVKAENLASYLAIWETAGQEAIKSGKIAMVYLGSWGEDTLKSWAPGTKGKWRATRLPFGAYGVDGSPALAISKNSKHKEIAWDLVKIIVTEDQKDYIERQNEKSEFLGGQEAQKLYTELRKRIPLTYSTPLDKKVDDLWKNETLQYYEYTYKEKNDAQALTDIEEKVKATYGKEIEILKETFKK